MSKKKIFVSIFMVSICAVRVHSQPLYLHDVRSAAVMFAGCPSAGWFSLITAEAPSEWMFVHIVCFQGSKKKKKTFCDAGEGILFSLRGEKYDLMHWGVMTFNFFLFFAPVVPLLTFDLLNISEREKLRRVCFIVAHAYFLFLTFFFFF